MCLSLCQHRAVLVSVVLRCILKARVWCLQLCSGHSALLWLRGFLPSVCISVEDVAGILMEIVLHLQIVLDSADILIVVSLNP